MEDVKLSAWGLADDLIKQADQGPRMIKHLFGRVGDEALAIADHCIREVVDRPKVSPWLRDQRVVGVFALRVRLWRTASAFCGWAGAGCVVTLAPWIHLRMVR